MSGMKVHVTKNIELLLKQAKEHPHFLKITVIKCISFLLNFLIINDIVSSSLQLILER